MVSVILAESCDNIFDDGKIITTFDHAAGTGGMLSTANNDIKRFNPTERISGVVTYVIVIGHDYFVYRFLFSCHNNRPPYDNLFYHRRSFKTLFTEKVSYSPKINLIIRQPVVHI